MTASRPGEHEVDPVIDPPAELSDPSCSTVLKDIWAFLDDELDPARRAVVERHLADCGPCAAETDLDRRLKVLVREKCGPEHAPSELRTSVLRALGEPSG